MTTLKSYLESLAERVGDKTYELHLSNGESLIVKEKPRYGRETWDWEIDGQGMSGVGPKIDHMMLGYLKTCIKEKLHVTDERVIFHSKQDIPESCGTQGQNCQRPGKCDAAFCEQCPVAEAFFAQRDGVKLVYAIASNKA